MPPNRGTVSTTAMSMAMSTGTAMTLVTVGGTLPCDAAVAAATTAMVTAIAPTIQPATGPADAAALGAGAAAVVSLDPAICA